MGRVRRYKKHKNFDMGARSGGKRGSSQRMDEPPELFEQRVRAKEKRHAQWEGTEEDKELLMRREALRTIRQENSIVTKNKTMERTIEPKKEDETLKQFKQRLRQETRKTLVEELQKRSLTAQKRKLRLKERSKARKLKKKGKSGYEEESIEFFTAADGRVRPSDRGDVPTSFHQKDHSISFGERVSRPPELHQFAAKLRKKSVKAIVESKAAVSEIENEELNNNSGINKKRKQGHIMHRDDMDGDDTFTYDHGTSSKVTTKRSKLNTRLNNDGSSTAAFDSKGSNIQVPGQSSAQDEMEALRARVIDAYKAVKDKRKVAAMSLKR